MPLCAAGRILFVLIQKGFKKIKFAVMHINERLNQVGLKLAFAEQTLKQQTDRKNDAFISLTATFGLTSWKLHGQLASYID